MSLLTPEPGLVFWMTLSFGAVLLFWLSLVSNHPEIN